MDIFSTITKFIDELSDLGLPISVAEKIDALSALAIVGLDDPGIVQHSLSTTLVQAFEHQSLFDTAFSVYFGTPEIGIAAALAGASSREMVSDSGADPGAALGSRPQSTGRGLAGLQGLDDAQIRRLVVDSLDAGERDTLLQRRLAAIIVERHARIRPGPPMAGAYYLHRAVRGLDQRQVLERLVERSEHRSCELRENRLLHRLLVEDMERRIAGFRHLIEIAIRQVLVANRGVEAVARTLRRPLPEDVDFLTAASGAVREMRDMVQPLAQKLAHQAVLRTRRTRGSVDFRATMRTALGSGGIPLQIRYHPPRPPKPELFVLADISGSVSAFATFTLQLAYAMRTQFSRIRCFVFIDGLDEITDLLHRSRNSIDIATQINRNGLGIWYDGRSDYGNALDLFWNGHGAELRSRTTVLMLGDARSNYRAPRAEILRKVSSHAGHVFWLNPETRTAWNSGDSVIGQYAEHCDEVVECRNIRQLRSFIDLLA